MFHKERVRTVNACWPMQHFDFRWPRFQEGILLVLIFLKNSKAQAFLLFECFQNSMQCHIYVVHPSIWNASEKLTFLLLRADRYTGTQGGDIEEPGEWLQNRLGLNRLDNKTEKAHQIEQFYLKRFAWLKSICHKGPKNLNVLYQCDGCASTKLDYWDGIYFADPSMAHSYTGNYSTNNVNTLSFMITQVPCITTVKNKNIT